MKSSHAQKNTPHLASDGVKSTSRKHYYYFNIIPTATANFGGDLTPLIPLSMIWIYIPCMRGKLFFEGAPPL